MTYGIPSMIRCDLTELIRNQGNLIRFCRKHQINKFLFLTIPFNIKFRGYDFFYVQYILVSDMPFVRSRVHGDAVGSEPLGVDGGFYNIRIISAPAVTQGGKFVYVD